MTHSLLITNLLSQLGGILLAVIILLAMVTVHEFGHYVVGKWLGFKINEFAVGFGPAILKKRSKKTGELFAVRVIPLGGYCAFDGEDYEEEDSSKTSETEEPFVEMTAETSAESTDVENQNEGGMYASNVETDVESQVKEEEYPEPQGEKFNDQAPWKRILVLLAGATMNYLLALLVIMTMFGFVGRPLYRVIDKAELETGKATVVTEDTDELQVGDILLKIDGQNLYLVTDYLDALEGKSAGEQVPVDVIRDGKIKRVWLTLNADANFASMTDTNRLLDAMGVDGLYVTTQQQGFFETIGHSFGYSVKIGGAVLRSLGELLTGKIGMESMGGPVTTITMTAEAASAGLMSFLNITAFIGVNLAVFNLLPVPALDGCKVIFCLIEWVRGKPINRKVETIIHFVGIILLFGFAILVDLLRLF